MILEYARREVVTARSNDLAQDVAGLMDYYRVGTVVIVERDHPIGIVTDRDLARSLLRNPNEDNRDVRTLSVSELMTPNPVTIREDEGFDRAVEIMSQQGIRRLPIVDRQGKLRGIVSLDDLLEDICRDLRAIERLIRIQQRVPREKVAQPGRRRRVISA